MHSGAWWAATLGGVILISSAEKRLCGNNLTTATVRLIYTQLCLKLVGLQTSPYFAQK